ncbi:TetR/AcrR family transcriptional regulator [Microbacterium karelineae]|uniref:TetR/AcrR family transcriptional regulator n=1 Tax=Microbacterium karelineae TaxID=2654283 RepID=UPI0012EAEAFA|nr:TetR/AcrR family transcriptional regulator [Microbacterium karelineae]
MSTTFQPLGRRERNKQAKLERITAAASELFAERGVDEVTTQQIADAADIGTGTLFLYAKTKGDLLLLVQNAHYAASLARGRVAAAEASNALGGVMALAEQIVECNRVHVENGRTYLREMVFGDPAEPHRAEALSIVAQTEEAVAGVLVDKGHVGAEDASTLAGVVTAIMFLTLANGVNVGATIPELLASIRAQVEAILPR